VCVLFLPDFKVDTIIGICHVRVGDGGTCSPDTETCSKKNATRGRSIEPVTVRVETDALFRLATPSPKDKSFE